jgi:hypothetical protein
MRMNFFKVDVRPLIFCFLFLLQLSNVNVVVATEVDPDTALKTILSLEKESAAFRWKGSATPGSLRSDTKVEEKYFFEVIYEPSSKRHWAAVSVGAQPGDPHPTHFLSFNGKQFESLEMYGSNDGQGTIFLEGKQRGVHARFWISSGTPFIGVSSGIHGVCDFMPVSPPDLLSSHLTEWIKNKQLVSITEVEKGVWIVVANVTIWTLPGANNPRTRIELRYDIGKGGVITEQKILAQRLDFTRLSVTDIPVMNWEITHVLNPKNQWVPKSIYRTDESVLRYVKIDFEEFEVNPPLKEDSFKINFPDGVYVDDFTKIMRYKVGAPIDENKAIEDFMRRHDLTGDVPDQTADGLP